MARPKSNQRLIEFLNSEWDMAKDSMDKAAACQDFTAAIIYKKWRSSLGEAISIINQEKEKNERRIKKE